MTRETISDGPTRKVEILAEHPEITITESRFSPGERGPDLHVHHEHVDAFYVLEGELTFELGPEGEPTSLGAGGFVAVPPHVAHSFVNTSTADARWLNFHAPDTGFADFLRTLRAGTPGQWDSFDMPADGGLPAGDALVRAPGEGERLVTGSRTVLIKGDIRDICVVEWELDGPFSGPPVHHHDAQVDAYYVVDGELELTLDGEQRGVGPGELAAAARGTEHTFNHVRDGRGRVVNIHAPNGGFADVLRRLANG